MGAAGIFGAMGVITHRTLSVEQEFEQARADAGLQEKLRIALWSMETEAATLLRRSESWLRHHGRELPGFHQNVPGGSVRWSEAALRQWMTGLAS